MNKEEKSTKFSLSDKREDTLGMNRGNVDLNDALKLLDEEDGHKISAKAESLPRDYLFAYILLRHLKIRDAKYKVRYRERKRVWREREWGERE